MAKKNDDFFKKKKVWSEVKDDVLGCYFKPYVQKILHTNRQFMLIVLRERANLKMGSAVLR